MSSTEEKILHDHTGAAPVELVLSIDIGAAVALALLAVEKGTRTEWEAELLIAEAMEVRR